METINGNTAREKPLSETAEQRRERRMHKRKQIWQEQQQAVPSECDDAKPGFFRRWLGRVFYIIVAMSILAGVNQYASIRTRLLSFDRLVTIARKYEGRALSAVYVDLVKDVRAEYGRHIMPEALDRSTCFFINSGGWMGQSCVLHASLFEYALIFNAGVESAGHSGRLWVSVSDFVGKGWLQEWKEGTMSATNYTQGQVTHHDPFVVNAVRFGEGSWYMECGYGMVPTTLLFVSSDTFFSTHDFVAWAHSMFVTARGVVRELWFAADEMMGGFKGR